jgi:hypothetical protein
MIICPFCDSTRIISARHDQDWSGGNRVSTVNPDTAYHQDDVDENGDVIAFGDIDIFVCLSCDYTWQRHGSFKK